MKNGKKRSGRFGISGWDQSLRARAVHPKISS
jgi:hypothetical protein